MDKAKQAQGNVANTVHGGISGGTVIQGGDVHLVHYTAHEVNWPVRIGVIPEEADHYQHRAVAEQLDQALDSFGTVALRQVLSGTGGVGKTQLAAHHARALRKATNPEHRIDLLIWVGASTRDQITYAYAQAALRLFATVPEDPEEAAQLFLAWLQDPANHHGRRWLIVWDDLTDPATVHDLWPPHEQPHGRMLVTTRRRDHTLTVQGRHLIDVDVYTQGEARAFLTHALAACGVPHTCEQLNALAHALGHLPLALDQAVTYMTELEMGCQDYLQVFHDRMNTLEEVFPDWTHPTPLAATWDLSLAQADAFRPQGVARPLMGLIALLDGTAVPEHVLTAPPALDHLTAHHTKTANARAETASGSLSPHQVRSALAGLRRLNLITRTTQPSAQEDHGVEGLALVGAHQLVQRATREHTTTRPTRDSVHVLADALIHVWPEIERDTILAQRLRSNTAALCSHHAVEGQTSEDWLWKLGGHRLLFRVGWSLGEAGRVGEALTHWKLIAETARDRLGTDHPFTFDARHNLARWLGEFGDPKGATSTLEQLLPDRTRVLGPNHPDTFDTRHNLAYWLGESGDPKRAITILEQLLIDRTRILGSDHRATLATRHNLARWIGESGDPKGATTTLEQLLTDQLRVLGPDHPVTLTTRHNLARWIGESGDPKGATTTLEQLLPDRTRVLGPNHPYTLATRHNLAHWTYESGDKVKAIDLLTSLVSDRTRVLGPDHSRTQTSRQLLQHWQDQPA